jgi:hypothetical protein
VAVLSTSTLDISTNLQLLNSTDDFAELKQNLSVGSGRGDSSVIVEGTVVKLAVNSVRSENAGIEGAARKVLSSSQGKTSTVSDISVPFLLTDPNGQSIRVTSVHRALRVSQVMERVWEEPSARPGGVPIRRELMLTFGTHLGLFGRASLNGANEVTLVPEEVDESLTVTVAKRKSQRRLLYAGSFILVLGGAAALIVNLIRK